MAPSSASYREGGFMKNVRGFVLLGLAAIAAGAIFAATMTTPPPWAFPVNPPAAPPRNTDTSPKHVPGSSVALTVDQTRDGYNVPDWHPDGHPPMPEIVAHGRKPEVRACGYCHLPNGFGRPENATIAGLPPDYIAQQIADFRSGARISSEPKMGPPVAMVAIAKAVPDPDVRVAAAYFSSLHLKSWIRVVETETVPKTHVSGSMLVPDATGGTEPIGERIIETPENLDRTELRDAASGFIAYAPVGSVDKGAALVTRGAAGKTTACGVCHGQDLRGLGPVPPIAGRSPSYVVRQLVDFQNGTRNGRWSALMKPVVAKLTVSDMVSIAAYTASRTP
jgi:cytochrome c553